MPPNTACPNCGQLEWLESPNLGHIPRIDRTDDGYVTDTNRGVNVRTWRCNNCLYLMMFWEPD